MNSVAEAYSIILDSTFVAQKEKVSLSAAVGRILAEPVFADRDIPPFDRVTMDGVALSWNEFQQGRRQFRIASVHAAGQPMITLHDPATCIEVMTGAMLPDGADTVIRYEDLTIADGIATVTLDKILQREAIHFRGSDARQNSLLLAPGLRIVAAEIALMASVGKTSVDIFRFPSTAIISTGDELVDIGDTPLTQQVRRSNAYALQAALIEMGCTATLYHVSDQKDALEHKLRAILENHSLIILSGGVSKGKFDFIPETLAGLGIRKVFHQVSQRPGKPFWFGTSDTKTVFALPGNPVSTYLCFYRYIKPWLLKSMGAPYAFTSAILAKDFTFSLPLTYFLQVSISNEQGRLMAYPDAGGGSGDFANLKDVDGFLELPKGKVEFRAGEVFSFIPFR